MFEFLKNRLWQIVVVVHRLKLFGGFQCLESFWTAKALAFICYKAAVS